MKPQIFQGPKGLKILICPNFYSSSVTSLFLVKVGTDLERKENNGISHFVEHLFFKGTKNFPSSQILRESLDKIGGTYNAFTSYQDTGFYIKVLPEFIEDALFILSDIILNPLFPEEEIEKERKVIFEEINRQNDDPSRLVVDLGFNLTFGDQPASWSILGTKRSLSKIKREDILNYVKRNYSTKNSLIVLSGKIKNVKKLLDFIRKRFSSYNCQLPKDSFKFKKLLQRYQEKIYYKKVDQAHIFIATPLPGFLQLKDRKYIFSLIARMLGGVSSSRLFSAIREELGAAYYIASYFQKYSNRSLIFIHGGINLDKFKFVLEKIIEELNKFKKEGPKEEELEKVKITLKSGLFIDLEDSLSLAEFYGHKYLWERKIELPEEIIKKIDKIKNKDIQRELVDIFNFYQTKLVAILPPNYKLSFTKIFKKLIK